ncbi:MAG: 50S ribosomal protein L11 methyltransferase [Acidiferrobacterales bacterium]
MPWLRVHLQVDRELADSVSDAMERCGAIAVMLEDAGNEALFGSAGNDEPRLWAHTSLNALLPPDAEPSQFVDDVVALLGTDARPIWRVDCLPDQDWERAWMDRFTPLHAGGNLWICPSWLAPPPLPAVSVILDPGLAFGTGTHATTALCLEWLAANIQPGSDVIDFGCGSGILAIAALKLGARKAWAVDIDANALVVACENAQRNDVGDRLSAVAPQSLPPITDADIVIANILAGPLIDLAPRLSALTRAGGVLLLSGMLEEQTAEVGCHYEGAFAVEIRIRDGWALLVCRKSTLSD